jgi:hypothetical protein
MLTLILMKMIQRRLIGGLYNEGSGIDIVSSCISVRVSALQANKGSGQVL